MAKLTFSINGKNANATRLDVKARSFSVVVDEPADLGGTDAGPNPVEYVLAGYAGCLNVVGHLVAKEMGMELKKFAVEVAGDLNPARFMGQDTPERAGFQQIRVKITADTSADDATLAKWLEAVEGRCPVSDNLSHATPISVGVNDLPPIVKH